jgi:hypothetical protein
LYGSRAELGSDGTVSERAKSSGDVALIHIIASECLQGSFRDGQVQV